MQQKKINSIQGLRCFAALIVCAMHIISSKPGLDTWVAKAQYIIQSIGHFGVDLFFTISGFIITWIVMKETKLPSIKGAICFLIKRLLRIYPLYWVSLGVMIISSILINHGNITQNVRDALHWPVFLLMVFHIPLQLPAWTLPFELYFYGVVFIFVSFFKKKYFLPFFIVWALAHFLTIQAIAYGVLSKYCFILMYNRVLEFFFGLLAGYLLYRYNDRYIADKYLSIALGCSLLFTGLWTYFTRVPYIGLTYWEVIYYYGFPAAFLIYGVVGLEMKGKLVTPKIFQKLGDISYSIYLWHFPIMQVTGYLSIYWLFYQHLHPLVQALFEISMVILISFASYRWIEKPCIQWSHKIVEYIK